uniref:BEACH-type PH domain-containing protein n=1 Tax=Ciona savignyi TaxID=51511 RepID=H2YT35_CIOSA
GSKEVKVPAHFTDVGALAKTSKSKFEVLKSLIKAVEVSDKDTVDTVFNLLVGGEFDLEINFIIHDEQCILYMLDVMEICSVQCQAEIWSTFKGICRKSYRNLQACVEVGLLQKLLYVLHDANEVISELLVDMLCLLASYNISVKELKKLLSLLRAEGDKWPVHAVKLLGVLQATTERHGPDCFFSFPGRHNAAIALPPLKAWPYSNGFTFTTWFRMDPLNSLRLDVDKPYLYCFRNSKGLGYSGHFVGNCFIVTVLKSRGKGFQHCLKFEFKPRKWYMVTVVHIYNRWRSSEIKCYANGQLVSHSEMNWSIGGSDQYDKCFLGSAETGDDARVFCGQIAATYVFNEALSPSQAYALYQLGPSYKNQFKFSTESDHLLANHHRKVLYEDSKLSDSLVLAYNPKSTDGQLCLECSPKSNRDNSSEAQRWFVHNPHALMLPGVKAVVTHSIHSALHSVGGAEVLFPLFSQLNYKQKDGSVDTSVCHPKILTFNSDTAFMATQQQVLHGKGFLVIGTLLERAHKDHITMGVLDTIMAMAKFLDQLSTGSALMRQFCDYILFNPALWIHTTPEVQIALYTFLATEFVSSPTIQTNLRRVSTVLLLIHALKHYYWVENPQPRSGVLPKGLDGPRPAKDEILSIRAFILLFLKQLVTRTGGILEDELQSILGYLLTMARVDENILDVLQLLVAMVSEHGGTVAPVFDQRNGVVAIFKLLGSRSESVRVHALKLLAYFLKNLNTKRKTELLETQSLFMLVGERLLLYSDEFSLTTYNAMYEVLVEEPSTQLLQKCHSEPSATTLISNPVMLKVIGTILRQCSSPHTMELKLTYLNDLLLLFQMSRDNRRILLQQSVWQDWMLELGYLKPCSVQERDCQELIYSIFKVLLYHAIKLEWGGWRVWVDTLAIVHSKVSFHAHKEYMERMYEEYKSSEMMSQDQGGISAITGVGSTDTNGEKLNGNLHAMLSSITVASNMNEIEIVVEEPTGITTEQAVEDEDQRSEDVLQDVGGRKEDGNDRKEEDQNEDDQVPEAKDADVQSDPDDAEEVDQDPTQQAQSEKEGFSQTENGTDDQDQKNDEVTKQSETEEEQPSDGEDESTSQPESSTEDQDDAEDETEEKTSTKEEEINDQVQEDPEEEEISAPEQNNETEDKNEVSTSDSNEVDGQGGKNDESVIKEDDLSQGQIETLEAKTPMEETDEKDEELSPPVEAGDAVGDKSTEEQSPVENNQIFAIKILRSEKLIKHTKSDGLVNPPFHQASITSPQQQFSPGPRTVVFRVPEFNWSEVHLRLLDDLFSCLEVDIENWKSTNKMVELVNHSDNLILVHNTIHLVSQMIDNVILACGGILPILSSATSPNYELDSVESGHGLSMESAWSILNRLAAFTDVLAFATNINFSEIENEKNMSNGGILRQCLRTACLCAVRNCLELRYLRTSASVPSTPSTSNDAKEDVAVSATEAAGILLSMMSNDATPVVDPHKLLQENDVNRLKASIYRDLDDTKQSQFLALAVVYFVSVLMVSKYRDILDPESHEKLRQATVANRNSPKKKKLVSVILVRVVEPVHENNKSGISSSLLTFRLFGYSGASMPSASKVSSAEVEAEEEDIPMDTVVLSNGHRSPENERNEEKEDPENKDGNLELCTNKSINFKKETKTLFKPKLQLVIQRARSKTKQKLAQMMNKVDILRKLTKGPDHDSFFTHERVSPNAFPVQVAVIHVTSIQSSYQSFDRSVVVQSKADDKQGILLPHKNIYFPTPSTSNMADKTTISTTVATDISMTNGDAVDHTDLPQIDATTMNVQQDEAGKEALGDVSSRLERSMDQLAPLLRDIFIDFSSYLSKILTGSHGQELLVEGMVCMKSYTSVVELVMLLCSQEWQNSIQKNAGLAFIELINEGRLLCHAMKDHVVRVANEADFILSKQRAEDVKRHAQFESSSALFLAQQREEERQCDSLITAAKHRDHAQAHALKNRITNILTNKLGAWGSAFNSRASEFWKLDSWEDDTRRRRRFVRNPYGSSHPKATLMSRAELNAAHEAGTAGSLPRSPSNYSTHGAEQLAANEDDVIAADDVDQEELQAGPVSFSTEADLIAPGVCLHGTFSITPDEFYFEVLEHHESFAKADPKVLLYIDGIHGKWLFQEVRAVFSRRYLLNNTALEIFLANRTCIMFNYPDADVMKKVVNYLPRVGIGTGCGLPQARRISLASPRQLLKSSNMTERWQRREVSNFEYIMFLNTISGRTFNDLNQYPVFPWVISNYDCEDLDLSLPSNFRDLSKPIGALNPKRSNYFASRYESWDDPTIPKFHYGTHYSNAAFTLGWLVRVEPFTSMFLNLQGGKFDHADRTFHSVQQSWKNCQRDSHDVKELIPEFYYLPEMFVNSNKYNLGKTSDGETLNDVKLPKWAKSADDFVRINRMALESEIVSCQIHQWIDLIFGFKQRGPEAVRATNVFYYLTYEGSVDLNKITDPVERSGLRDQIKNFGQTPSQLQMVPHPPRSSAMHITPMMFKEPEAQDVIMVLKFQSNSPVVYVTANTHPSLQQPAVFTCTKNLHFCVNKWNQTTAPSAGDLDKPKLLPIEPDPLTNHGVNSAKRQIAETLDQSVEVHRGCFSVTADNKYLLSCGYWDRSFRIVYVESGALHQVVFGHWDVVTCISRSETYIGGDCYFVTGSRDATLMLWYWSGRRHLIVGDSNTLTENPTARAILTGHDTEITCAAVCAELGLIASGSLEGPILLHTITGDLLRSLEPDLPPDSGMPSSPQPELIVFTNEGMVIASYKQGLLCNFTMNGRNLSSKIIDDNIKGMLGSNNSQFLVTGGDKGVVQVWSAWDFNHLYTFPQCDAGIRAIALSHDQKTVITGMTSGSIVAFHINFNRWHYEYQNVT